jgi:uncharacterized membrane protein
MVVYVLLFLVAGLVVVGLIVTIVDFEALIILLLLLCFIVGVHFWLDKEKGEARSRKERFSLSV